MLDRFEIRHSLTGPVPSVSVPFLRDGAIDWPGLRSFVDVAIVNGARTVMLTYGDSLYSLLTDDEVAAVTRAVVQHTAGRAMVIAADRVWWTGKTVEFACCAREMGADLLMVLPPNWAGSSTPQTLADHYAAIAAEMPVMVVTGVFATTGAAFGLETLDLLVSRQANVVAVKDDVCGAFGRKLGLRFHEHLALLSGGQKQNHLDAWPYGCDGYLSTFIGLKPEITWRYWRAIEAGDVASATAIIRDHDMPLFDFILPFPGGFDAAMHGLLELAGIAGRWRRPPYYSLSDAEMERLADGCREHGWL
jgi:4-hydroxy-tetrahydrodipicolinate synthase